MGKNNFLLRYQFALAVFLPILLLALAFTIFYNIQYNHTLKQHLDQLGDLYLRAILPETKNALRHHDKQYLQKIAQKTLNDPSIISVAFYSAKGHLINQRGEKMDFQEIIIPANDDPNQTTISGQRINDYTYHLIASIVSNHQLLGWITLDMDSKLLLIEHYQTHLITLGLVLMGCFFALIAYLYLSRQLIDPVTRLRRSMKQILRNEFETHIKMQSTGDMGLIEQGCVHLQKQYLTLINEFNQAIEVATADLQQSLELVEEKNVELSLSRKKIEEKNRQKSEFIANMSHEIRTPMNGILGFTQVLLESTLDSLQQDYVKTIHASAQDLLTIINDILDFSKMDAGKLHLDSLPLNIRHCIDEVLALNAPTAHKKGLELIPTTSTDVPHKMLGDPVRMKQLLHNLISNAIKYTDHGYVLIRTSVSEVSEKTYTLKIAVIDTGMGISDEEKATLFNAFTQINNTITRRQGGTGLGLVICKKLVEHMQGRITLTSEPAKGTTFTISVKLAKLQTFEVEKNQQHRFSCLRILCFEENPLHMEALCNGLGTWGIQAFPVRALTELPDAFQSNPDCDIAFINVNQGFEHTIREIIKKQTIPCILISKWYLPHFEDLGGKALLFKPPSLQKLHDSIETILKLPRVRYPDVSNLQRLRFQLSDLNSRLLIAEDNPTTLWLLQSWLKNFSQVDQVNDGKEAVEACFLKKYSAILLDLQMPNLNGLDAAKTIRYPSNLNHDTPIILISASQNSLTPKQLHKQGIDLCLEKPIQEAQLLQLLIELIQKNQAIDWQLCIKKVSGNEFLAAEFLFHFIHELIQNKARLLSLYKKSNIPGIEQLAHKLHGACCFTGVTQLQSHVALLENQAKQASTLKTIETFYNQLLQSIDAVLEEYNHIYKNKISAIMESQTT